MFDGAALPNDYTTNVRSCVGGRLGALDTFCQLRASNSSVHFGEFVLIEDGRWTMATVTRNKIPNLQDAPFEEVLQVLSREERFMATVSAMNALLIQKGVYSSEEFEGIFRQWAE